MIALTLPKTFRGCISKLKNRPTCRDQITIAMRGTREKKGERERNDVKRKEKERGMTCKERRKRERNDVKRKEKERGMMGKERRKSNDVKRKEKE